MRRLAVLVVVLAVVACKKSQPARPAAGAPPEQALTAAAGAQLLQGKVLERVDVSQYSYLRLATASGEVWTAVQRTDRKAGDQVAVSNAFPMQNFESKELGRKFDVVYFGSLAEAGGQPAAMPPGAAASAAPAAMPPGGAGGAPPAAGAPVSPADMAAQHQAVATGPSDVKVQKVAKAAGNEARTIQEIWAQRDKLKGKAVIVRGQVVKSTPVMGRVFVHLRDGSGTPDKKDNDVTVTTRDEAAVGDVVTARGTVILDKDFGSGYAYPVLLEDAKLSK